MQDKRSFSPSDLSAIQGLGIAGFKKDHQEVIFFRMEPATAKELVSVLRPRVANAREVADFNRDFSAALHQHGGEPKLAVLWIGLGFSAAGLAKLGVDLTGLPAGQGLDAFSSGMAARSAAIGDAGPNDPTHWHAAFRSKGAVDGVLVIAGDERVDVDETAAEIAELLTAHDAEIVFQERGAVLSGELRGHEHFGFRDGASQPKIAGYDAGTSQGALAPGEFVLGHPDSTGSSPTLPAFFLNGSFMVFRRLVQDVASFRSTLAAGVPGADPPVGPDLLGAKMVGRWPSGAPLEKYPDKDPGEGHNENDFAYHASDEEGLVVPTWGHIRKANPRDETLPTGSGAEDDPRRHRMIRRGIPFGDPLPAGSADDGKERGLHFISVVADVARQFEFVQLNWLNNENFPRGSSPAIQGGTYAPPPSGTPADGPDPVVGEGNPGKSVQLHQPSGLHQLPLSKDFVRVSAGEYFFLPALDAMGSLER
jgi:Dyp-type peroxidase family